MSPRAWIVAGWLFLAAAAIAALIAVAQVLHGTALVPCADLAGVSCQPSNPQVVPGLGNPVFVNGLIWAVAAGVAFFVALASFFWAAHLRTLTALQALADALH